jgi:hypothetical protein
MAALTPILVSRLEKAATDNGFDQSLKSESGWLTFASTQCPLRVWLGIFGDSFLVALSQQNVVRALGEYGTPMAASIPKSAVGGRTVPDIPALHRLLRRAFPRLAKLGIDGLLVERHGHYGGMRQDAMTALTASHFQMQNVMADAKFILAFFQATHPEPVAWQTRPAMYRTASTRPEKTSRNPPRERHSQHVAAIAVQLRYAMRSVAPQNFCPSRRKARSESRAKDIARRPVRG